MCVLALTLLLDPSSFQSSNLSLPTLNRPLHPTSPPMETMTPLQNYVVHSLCHGLNVGVSSQVGSSSLTSPSMKVSSCPSSSSKMEMEYIYSLPSRLVMRASLSSSSSSPSIGVSPSLGNVGSA
jgi:hypothetical protein